jgi:hypothetical protein
VTTFWKQVVHPDPPASAKETLARSANAVKENLFETDIWQHSSKDKQSTLIEILRVNLCGLVF